MHQIHLNENIIFPRFEAESPLNYVWCIQACRSQKGITKKRMHDVVMESKKNKTKRQIM